LKKRRKEEGIFLLAFVGVTALTYVAHIWIADWLKYVFCLMLVILLGLFGDFLGKFAKRRKK